MQNRRQPEIIAGRVNSDGTIAAGDGFTVAKGGAGSYTVTFAPGFRLITATASSGGGSAASVQCLGWTGNSFTPAPITTAAAFVDAPFSFTAVGVQT